MAHTTRDKAKLLARVRRIKGQVAAIEEALQAERDCSAVLQQITSCRGAINGLMAEVLEGHVRCHVLDPKAKPDDPQSDAAEELIEIIKTYLR
jgi:DNA-binding FrmR family transcriptional regulator